MDTQKNEDLVIYGKMVSMSTEGVVADALQIYDSGMLKHVNTGKQNDINQFFKNKVDTISDNIYNLNNRIDNLNDIESIPTSILSQILVLK